MTDLTCREATEFLADYLAHELSLPEREAFEAHLLECADCVAYLRQYEETIRLGREAFEDADAPAERRLPPELLSAILAARRGR